MIPPKKRMDLSITMVVSPELRRDLVELAESGAVGGEACSVSEALRVLLPSVMGRMEAGEALAASPYERVATKQGLRLSFRHDEAFAERVEALRVSDEGGRGALSSAAFWVELLGRAVALARAGEPEAPATVAVEPEVGVAVEPTLLDLVDPGAPPFSLSLERWEEIRRQVQEEAAGRQAEGRAQAVRPPVPVNPNQPNEPSTEAVFTALMRAQRAVFAAHDDRPPPSGKLNADADFTDMVEEGVKLFTELMDSGSKRRR
jgi:hypothetical protein